MPDFLKVKKNPTKRSGAPRGAYLSFVFANTKRGSLSCLPNETRWGGFEFLPQNWEWALGQMRRVGGRHRGVGGMGGVGGLEELKMKRILPPSLPALPPFPKVCPLPTAQT